MTKIKLCGLSRIEDIEAANMLKPDFIGFVFASKSKRRVSHLKAAELKSKLNPETKAVGVFLDDDLDGSEDEEYIAKLRAITDKPIIKAFIINNENDVRLAEESSADYILLDGGKGEGRAFNWKLLEEIKRPFFLAGGLNADNAEAAVADLHPFAVDVSTGIETDGVKDKEKMTAFVAAVRKGEAR